MKEPQYLAENFVNGNAHHVRTKLAKLPAKVVIRTVKVIRDEFPNELDCFLRFMSK